MKSGIFLCFTSGPDVEEFLVRCSIGKHQIAQESDSEIESDRVGIGKRSVCDGMGCCGVVSWLS